MAKKTAKKTAKKAARAQINFTLPQDLLDRIKARNAKVGPWARKAVERAITSEELNEELKEGQEDYFKDATPKTETSAPAPPAPTLTSYSEAFKEQLKLSSAPQIPDSELYQFTHSNFPALRASATTPKDSELLAAIASTWQPEQKRFALPLAIALKIREALK